MQSLAPPRRAGQSGDMAAADLPVSDTARGGHSPREDAAGGTPFIPAASERLPETPMQRHVRRKAWGATWGAIMRDAWKATEAGAK